MRLGWDEARHGDGVDAALTAAALTVTFWSNQFH